MKVLLMGGTGWLGHEIALQLAAKGIDFTILSRGQKPQFADKVSQFPTIVADKKDDAAMREVFKTRWTHIIDTVPTEPSIALVKKYCGDIAHYIHCSSTGGYAPLPFVPCNETAPYNGFAKSTGWDKKRIYDETVMDFFNREGFPATVIRPCYITGPGMLPLDNLGGRRTEFISDIYHEKVLDVPVDGQSLLQPIHVYDLATSFVLALENPRTAIGQTYNICLDYAVPLNRYLEINAAVFGKKPVINYMSIDDLLEKYGREDETGLRFVATHMCFTIEKAKRDLGYKPHCTPEEAIEETALWAAKVTGVIK